MQFDSVSSNIIELVISDSELLLDRCVLDVP